MNRNLMKTIKFVVVGVFCFLLANSIEGATYTVTKTADTNGTCNSGVDCSLREAIRATNSTPDDDTINFSIPTSDPGCPGGVCTITLNSSFGQLTINSGSGRLTIMNVGGAQRIEISGNNAVRVFLVNGGNLTINNLTVRDGFSGNLDGGGIYNAGTLTMTNCTVSGNKTDTYGGGILNFGTATIIGSTISNNFANMGFGGGITNQINSTLNIINSTISHNSANNSGGIANNGTVNIINSTISNNFAVDAGGINNLSGTINVRNSIIANNITISLVAQDFSGTLTSQGYNLIGNTTGTNITGTTTGNILNQDPRLAPLGDYGGPTRTQPPLPDSPAINAGSNALATDINNNTLTTDQRGANRIFDSTVDMGAHEVRIFTVTNTNDGGAGSLRDAVGQANSSSFGGGIRFNIPTSDPGCSGNTCTIGLISSSLDITSHVLISNEASINRKIEISGSNLNRAFSVASGASLLLTSLTIKNASVGSSDGGGIINAGLVNIFNSTLKNNSGFNGGSISNAGTVNLINSTISGNTAHSGDGGAIYNAGIVNLKNTTISNNTAIGIGGGIQNSGAGVVSAGNTIIAGNSASSASDFSGTLTSRGNNLIGNTNGTTITGTTTGNILNQNARLAPLANNGGLTETHALLLNSPAINAGNYFLAFDLDGFPLRTDQRRAARIYDGAVDIGAYEFKLNTVTNTNDSGSGSLRDAIAQSLLDSYAGVIRFNISGCSGNVCVISLSSQLNVTGGNLIITNEGGARKIEISGNDSVRVFQVSSGADLTINSLTVRNGISGLSPGGGILNQGTLTIINSTVRNNSPLGDGGGIYNDTGATLTVINSTISNNSAGGFGGGIRNLGTVTIINSTISDNSAGNFFVGGGGGIRNDGTVNARNTIIANNSILFGRDPDFAGTLNSQGYNLIENTTGTTITGITTGNILNQDPRLAPLGNYGGLTNTHALLLGSPALNAGSNSLATDQSGNPLATDQRGASRVSDGTVDIGAYEQRVGLVTNTADSGAGSLRGELSSLSPFGGLIRFNISGCSGNVCVITLSSQITITGLAIISNEIGTQKIEISGNNSVRVFFVNGGNLTINNLTVRNGYATVGGGIHNIGTLTVINSTIRDSVGDAGGILNEGTATIIGSTISNNLSDDVGGGIHNKGIATIINSTISNNSSISVNGGGIFNDHGAKVTIINSTISNNSALDGGGIGNVGTTTSDAGIVTIINSTISNNYATISGGGIANGGIVNARNTIIANNTVLGSRPDFNGTLTSQGNNLIGNTSGTTITGTTTGNILNQNPLLTPLGYYGGGTWTRALLTTSPALNTGNNCVTNLSCSSNNPPSAVTTDQRGASRTDSGRGTAVDIGAYEVNTGYVASLPNGTQSLSYSFLISRYQASEGTFNFSMTGLPSGLSLTQSTSGGVVTVQITGTPTQTGNFTPQLTITSGSRTATVNYSLSISAPVFVSISGRVFGDDRTAYMVLTDNQGESRGMPISTFGYYRFSGVMAGRTYTLTVRSKRYVYESRVLFVTEDVTGVDFYPTN